MRWKFYVGPLVNGRKVQDDLSGSGDYTISHHGPGEFNASYRPTGQHHHVGTYPTLAEAKKGCEQYEKKRLGKTAIGTIESDTPILPYAVADSVIEEIELVTGQEIHDRRRLAEQLGEEAERIYQLNDHFRRQIRAKGNAGRDQLYIWMRHWLASHLHKSQPAILRMLTTEFSNGSPARLKPTVKKGMATIAVLTHDPKGGLGAYVKESRRALTDPRSLLVVTGGHGAYSVTHQPSGASVAFFFRAKDAKAALAELMPLTDWNQDLESLSRLPGFYDQVRAIELQYRNRSIPSGDVRSPVLSSPPSTASVYVIRFEKGPYQTRIAPWRAYHPDGRPRFLGAPTRAELVKAIQKLEPNAIVRDSCDEE